MRETINERVSVITHYDSHNKQTQPLKVKWNGRVYHVTQVGYLHRRRDGRSLIHVFSVVANTLAMCLELNTETLNWTLKEVSDGLAD